MKRWSYSEQQKTVQKILKMLDGLDYESAKNIIDSVAHNIFKNAYVEITGFEQKIVLEYDASRLEKQFKEFTEDIIKKYGGIDEDEDAKEKKFDEFVAKLQALMARAYDKEAGQELQ